MLLFFPEVFLFIGVLLSSNVITAIIYLVIGLISTFFYAFTIGIVGSSFAYLFKDKHEKDYMNFVERYGKPLGDLVFGFIVILLMHFLNLKHILIDIFLIYILLKVVALYIDRVVSNMNRSLFGLIFEIFVYLFLILFVA